jgi:adenosylhomocysteinase
VQERTISGDVESGQARIDWADSQMPVLAGVRERFERERPLEGVSVAACLHVTAETANLVRALLAGGARVGLCAANPLSTQDDVVVALTERHGATVLAQRGESPTRYGEHVQALVTSEPQVTIDDGADLVSAIHESSPEHAAEMLGATEETTAGLLRVRALAEQGTLACPVLAVNESRAERAFNDRFGTGQSTIDGILRATNLLMAGRTVVVFGYGWTGRGVALRARGAGASVIVCEVDPLRALEARMEGYEVMGSLAAAERGDVFITVTGGRDVLRGEHFERMKDGAVLANAGHFDVEIDIEALRALATGGRREALPLVEEHRLADGRRLNLLAQGRVVNLAAGQGHPAAVMDMSFAGQALCVEHLVACAGRLSAGVLAVPEEIDDEVARLKLASLGVEIDELSDEQRVYRTAWESNPHSPA